LQKRLEMIEHAGAFRGRPRERMIAIGEADELYLRLYPHHYRAMQTVRIASQLGRSVPAREDEVEKYEKQVIVLLSDVIAEGLRNGDLWLGRTRGSGELAFMIWALAVGTRSLLDSKVVMWRLGIDDSRRLGQETTDLLLDALGWRPLSDEWDYAATRKRIAQEVFAAELNEVKSNRLANAKGA
jgi:hypothetical protein